MENQRIILFFALSIVLLLIWQAWQADYGSETTATSARGEQVTPAGNEDVPAVPQREGGGDVPQVASTTQPAATESGTPQGLPRGQRIHVVTDTLDIEIDVNGGDIREADLPTFPVDVHSPDKPYRLMQDQGQHILIAQSGLLSKQAAPDHYAVYRADRQEYRLAADADTLTVPLHWRSDDGIEVTKTYTFHRGSFLIDVRHEVNNGSDAPWSGNQYTQFQRTKPGSDESSAFVRTYIGGVIYSEEDKYQKYDFDDMDSANLSRDISNGWAAMIQHYFFTAWIPPRDQSEHFYSKAPQQRPYVLGMVSPPKSVAAGEQGTFNTRLYIGPKEQARIEKIATGLRLTVDYGILTVLSQPLFWLLTYIHKVIGNWGFAIIILTLLIKLVFYKLSEKSYKSMANMRRLTPKITQIRERYGDDRQRMSQAMMELYKKEKINPLGGCLPILIQIPVFVALYWVLLESVELRQAPFIGWITDLSTRDPYYILPVLMGITMFIQQKLNPPPPDPVQAKVLMALPFIFTAFFAFFPSGLVLYWVANSVLSIAQQWVITRRIEAGAKS